jgi:PAS domain S-box-containing protein
MWFSISVYSPAAGHFVAVFDVITDRKKAEATLRESEERFREMVEGAEIAVFLSLDMKFTYLNPAALRLFGAETADQLLGQPTLSRIHPDYHESVRKQAAKLYHGQRINEPAREIVYLRLDGTTVPAEAAASPFTYRGRNGAVVFVQDISARKRAEQAHLESEAQFQATFEQAAVGMAQGSLDGRWLRVNQRLCDIVGYSREELTQITVQDITHPADLQVALAFMREAIAGELETYTLDKRYIRKDRSIVPVTVTVSLVRDASDKPKQFIIVVEDITERKRAEEARSESERKFRNLFESSQDAIMTSPLLPGRFTSGNLATVKMFGAKDEAELISHGAIDLSPQRQPDGRLSSEKIPEMIEVVARKGFHSFEWMHQRIGGETFLAEVRMTLVKQNGKDQILGTVTDITERKRVEKALRDSEERFREIAESIEEVFWVADPTMSQILYVSPAYEKVWGQPCHRLYAQARAWLAAIHPEDQGRIAQAIEKKRNTGAYDEEYRIVRPDGQIRWIQDKAFPVYGTAGQVQRVVGVARDITDARQLEEQFRQSQKMEAIGQLAGGVAHDFNNILGATMLQTEMAEMVENLPDEVRESLHEIRAYAQRAANLTRQLLLFSRRQVMQPRDLDLNEVVTNLAKMLQRMIGEDVRLQLNLNSTPLLTHSDAGMLDQVLMNLAVNSRDAMPRGGRLIIETTETMVEEESVGPNFNVAPGRYVCLRVTDTGCGIPPEVLPRIFEPFFTTKEAGKGTGLGLATVFGIVRQHRGWVKVDSTPGIGTTFQVLLPDGVIPSPQMIQAAAQPKPRGGAETVLLVEDESAIRTLTGTILKRNGYQVLDAADGREALTLWQQHRGAVTLLVTDLVMPRGLSGQELARQLQADEPKLKVLFVSGYSGEIAGQELQLLTGENYLQKPFASDKLLQAVRQCLDE